MTDRSTLFAYLALGAGVLCLGFSGIFVKWANAPGPVTGFYRMAIVVLLLAWPFWQRVRQRFAAGGVWWRQLPQPATKIALLSGFFFACDLTFWNTGILLSGATNPTLMGNTSPLWVGIGAYFLFREKLGRSFWLGLGLSLAGAVLILGLDALRGFSLGLGTSLGLFAGMFYGAYFLATQRSRQYLDSLTAFWLAALSSTLVLLLFCLVARLPLLGYSTKSYLSFLGLGVIVQGVGQFAFSYALGYLPASLVSPAGLAQPVITAILAVPLLGEEITPGQIVGGVVVLTGIYIVQRSRQRRRPVVLARR